MYRVINKSEREYKCVFGDQHQYPDTFEVWNTNSPFIYGELVAITSYKEVAEKIARALSIVDAIEATERERARMINMELAHKNATLTNSQE